MVIDKIKSSLRPILNRFLVIAYREKYFIRPDYTPNFLPKAYIDNPEFADRYQVEVYLEAKKIAQKYKLKSIIDVGCGHGVKLAKYIQPLSNDITGVDVPASINYCLSTYNFGTWIADDITRPKYEFARKYDLVLSVDVIEHLINPDNLLDYLKKLAHDNTIFVISTPERFALRGPNHLGPAGQANPAHVREWSKNELAAYLTSRNFKILKHTLVNDVTGVRKKIPGRNFGKTCQVVICKLG